MIVVGGVLHLVVVLLPFVLLSGSLRDPAVLAFAIGVSALYLGDATTMRWTSPPSRSALDARAHRWAALTGGVLLLLFWSCLTERALIQPSASWLQAGGALALGGGVALRFSAVRTLGENFRTEIEAVDGELVERGVYRFARHPSESGLLAASLGAAVLLQSAAGIALWCAVLLPVTLVRVSLEESALIDRFGEAYRRYAERVGGFVHVGNVALVRRPAKLFAARSNAR